MHANTSSLSATVKSLKKGVNQIFSDQFVIFGLPETANELCGAISCFGCFFLRFKQVPSYFRWEFPLIMSEFHFLGELFFERTPKECLGSWTFEINGASIQTWKTCIVKNPEEQHQRRDLSSWMDRNVINLVAQRRTRQRNYNTEHVEDRIWTCPDGQVSWQTYRELLQAAALLSTFDNLISQTFVGFHNLPDRHYPYKQVKLCECRWLIFFMT